MNWNECSRCGAWLSLGPSNDSPEAVQIEIRAAEVAADWDRFNDDWFGLVSLGSVSPEMEHLPILEKSLVALPTELHRKDLQDYLAGYLANAIATHEDEDREARRL